jgi:biopolymer transport protein ExbD
MQILDKRDFERFFATILKDTLSIYINKNNQLHYNQAFKIKLKSSKKGYITILDIYDDGTVAILAKNIPIKNSITFPNEEYDLVADNKDTIDLYVAIRSDKKLILDDFAMADEEFITDERYKNFDELLRFLKNRNFSSVRVVTKK